MMEVPGQVLFLRRRASGVERVSSGPGLADEGMGFGEGVGVEILGAEGYALVPLGWESRGGTWRGKGRYERCGG